MSATGAELAMFPLGTVLFPTMPLPLHVFEPRYRAMTSHLLAGDVEPEFGVVLIERGSEVGGGEHRTDIGTVARIQEAAELPDGRWALIAVGTRRVHVVEWLPDDPWPRAIVADVVDTDADAGGWPAAMASLRQVLAMAAELGEASAPATIELADDPTVASFQAAALAPLGPMDQQRLLGIASLSERIALLSNLLAEQAELLAARLSLG